MYIIESHKYVSKIKKQEQADKIVKKTESCMKNVISPDKRMNAKEKAVFQLSGYLPG